MRIPLWFFGLPGDAGPGPTPCAACKVWAMTTTSSRPSGARCLAACPARRALLSRSWVRLMFRFRFAPARRALLLSRGGRVERVEQDRRRLARLAAVRLAVLAERQHHRVDRHHVHLAGGAGLSQQAHLNGHIHVRPAVMQNDSMAMATAIVPTWQAAQADESVSLFDLGGVAPDGLESFRLA